MMIAAVYAHSNERSRPASVLSVPPAKPTTTFGWNPKQSWLYHSLAIAPARRETFEA
jgi:hypothetical protein